MPPPGERPIKDKWKFYFEVLGIFALWLVLWAVFRIGTADLVRGNEIISAIFSIVMAPTLTLIPPIIWWRKRMRERGIPYLLTRKNLFSSVLVACLAVIVFFIFMNLSYPVLVGAMGVQVEEDLQFFAAWRGQSLEWLISVTFLYMFIVGPVEELFHRGFIQDQINRRFPIYFGIFTASIVFVLGHVPIDFMVYEVTAFEWLLRWVSSFPFAISMGVFYHWSRNIWGVAVYHGLYDLFLGLSFLEYGSGAGVEMTEGQIFVLFLVWFIGETIIIIAMSYAAYRLLWQKDRPAGSLGFRVRGISYAASTGGLVRRAYDMLATRRIVQLARRVDLTDFRHQTIMSSFVIVVVILGNLGFSGVLGVVPATPEDGNGGGGEGPDYTDDATVLPLETEHDYIYEDETKDYLYDYEETREFVRINVTLSWQDEAAFRTGYTNEPDVLLVEVALDDGTNLGTLVRDSSGSGRVRLEWSSLDPVKGEAIYVSVTAETCGDQVPTFGGPLGLRVRADNGNTFDLEVEMTVAD